MNTQSTDGVEFQLGKIIGLLEGALHRQDVQAEDILHIKKRIGILEAWKSNHRGWMAGATAAAGSVGAALTYVLNGGPHG